MAAIEDDLDARVRGEIQILYVEDAPEDALLVEIALNRSGLVFQLRRVDNEGDFRDELEEHPPDVILSDHGLPTFSGFSALAIARDKCPDAPFIFVTAALGEEMAIQTFEHGATDYVLKDRLGNLASAVRRALRTAEEKRLRKLLDEDRERLVEELNDTLAKVLTLSGLLHICAHCKQIRDDQDQWQPMEAFFQQHLNVLVSHGLCPECAPRYFPPVRTEQRNQNA